MPWVVQLGGDEDTHGVFNKRVQNTWVITRTSKVGHGKMNCMYKTPHLIAAKLLKRDW